MMAARSGGEMSPNPGEDDHEHALVVAEDSVIGLVVPKELQSLKRRRDI